MPLDDEIDFDERRKASLLKQIHEIHEIHKIDSGWMPGLSAMEDAANWIWSGQS